MRTDLVTPPGDLIQPQGSVPGGHKCLLLSDPGCASRSTGAVAGVPAAPQLLNAVTEAGVPESSSALPPPQLKSLLNSIKAATAGGRNIEEAKVSGADEAGRVQRGEPADPGHQKNAKSIQSPESQTTV